MNGTSVLSITDIPFVYSLANLLFIASTGTIEVERLVIIGLLAGIGGTFLVFWHPIQWIIDRLVLLSNPKFRQYKIKNPGHVPDNYTLDIKKGLFRLSLNTHGIKYQKDKFVSLIYFMIILGTLGYIYDSENFQKVVEISDSYKSYIPYGAFVMLLGIGWFLTDHGRKLKNNLKLNSLYFMLSNDIIGYGNESNLIKNAIDLNDWATAKEIIHKQIRNRWEPMKRFSV